MSTYHYLGCERCKESVAFMSDGMAGVGWMGGAQAELPLFFEKHLRSDCEAHLRIFSEHDYRNDDFAEFKATA